MDKTESNVTACQQAAFERCINFMAEMLEKYGNTNIIANDNIDITEADNDSVA